MCIDLLFSRYDFENSLMVQGSPCYLAKMLHFGSKDTLLHKYLPSAY